MGRDIHLIIIYRRGGLGGIFIALLGSKRGGMDKMSRGVAHKRGRRPISKEEGMKVRMPCSIYRLEERDRKRGNLALLQAG